MTSAGCQAVPFKLSYVDFAPRCAGAGGVVCTPDYERFNVLVSRANDWLKSNIHLRVKTCESIEVKGGLDGVVDTTKSCYFEADHAKRRMRNIYIRALRLWVVPRTNNDVAGPQQIGYVNIVPARNQHGGFESFGDAVRRFNDQMRQRPLPGCILNVESQEMKFHEWGMDVDPDESCWVESVKFNVSFLVVIRVFFEFGFSACEEIGCADFVPSRLDAGGSHYTVPQFECFGEVLRKAANWIQMQHRVRVTNVQSIDYKLKHEADFVDMDSQRSFFVESGRRATRYIRVVRIGFVKPFDGRDVVVDRPLAVNYVTFEPQMLSSGGIFGIPLFETMSQTMKRAMDWLQMVDADLEVISAETVPVRMYSGNQYGNHEVTYTWNRGEQKEFWLLVIRIYFSGAAIPVEMLPQNVVQPMNGDSEQTKTSAASDGTPCCRLL